MSLPVGTFVVLRFHLTKVGDEIFVEVGGLPNILDVPQQRLDDVLAAPVDQDVCLFSKVSVKAFRKTIKDLLCRPWHRHLLMFQWMIYLSAMLP